MKLTRMQLYLWAWSTPVTRIADVLGMSATWVYVQTRRYQVPTPPRGYWQQLNHGKATQREPLPNPTDVRLTDVEVDADIGQMLNHETPALGLVLETASGQEPGGVSAPYELHSLTAPAAQRLIEMGAAFRGCEDARRLLISLEGRIGSGGTREQLLVMAWLARARIALDAVDPCLQMLASFGEASSEGRSMPEWLWRAD